MAVTQTIVTKKFVKVNVGERKVVRIGRTAAVYIGREYLNLIGRRVIVEILVPLEDGGDK